MWHWKDSSGLAILYLGNNEIVRMRQEGSNFYVEPTEVYKMLIDNSRVMDFSAPSMRNAKLVIANKVRYALIKHTELVGEKLLK